MKSTQLRPQAAKSGRRIAGRAQQDHIRDPYQAQRKPKEPGACPQCGAVYHRGRWQWGQRPDDAHGALCPACRRIADRMPAGVLTLHGPFARTHKAEVTGLVRNVEGAEQQEHPLNRIMSIEESGDGLVINTTDIHLPRRLGEALRSAYHGTLDMDFDEDQYFVRIDWRPPA
jgi:NMD protein affecting ribosome stability and mRNA decay